MDRYCENHQPGVGEFACFSDAEQVPDGPPGSIDDWTDMGCDRSPGECRSRCDGVLFSQVNPDKCSDNQLPYSCYCKK